MVALVCVQEFVLAIDGDDSLGSSCSSTVAASSVASTASTSTATQTAKSFQGLINSAPIANSSRCSDHKLTSAEVKKSLPKVIAMSPKASSTAQLKEASPTSVKKDMSTKMGNLKHASRSVKSQKEQIYSPRTAPMSSSVKLGSSSKHHDVAKQGYFPKNLSKATATSTPKELHVTSIKRGSKSSKADVHCSFKKRRPNDVESEACAPLSSPLSSKRASVASQATATQSPGHSRLENIFKSSSKISTGVNTEMDCDSGDVSESSEPPAKSMTLSFSTLPAEFMPNSMYNSTLVGDLAGVGPNNTSSAIDFFTPEKSYITPHSTTYCSSFASSSAFDAQHRYEPGSLLDDKCTYDRKPFGLSASSVQIGQDSSNYSRKSEVEPVLNLSTFSNPSKFESNCANFSSAYSSGNVAIVSANDTRVHVSDHVLVPSVMRVSSAGMARTVPSSRLGTSTTDGAKSTVQQQPTSGVHLLSTYGGLPSTEIRNDNEISMNAPNYVIPEQLNNFSVPDVGDHHISSTPVIPFITPEVAAVNAESNSLYSLVQDNATDTDSTIELIPRSPPGPYHSNNSAAELYPQVPSRVPTYLSGCELNVQTADSSEVSANEGGLLTLPVTYSSDSLCSTTDTILTTPTWPIRHSYSLSTSQPQVPLEMHPIVTDVINRYPATDSIVSDNTLPLCSATDSIVSPTFSTSTKSCTYRNSTPDARPL